MIYEVKGEYMIPAKPFEPATGWPEWISCLSGLGDLGEFVEAAPAGFSLKGFEAIGHLFFVWLLRRARDEVLPLVPSFVKQMEQEDEAADAIRRVIGLHEQWLRGNKPSRADWDAEWIAGTAVQPPLSAVAAAYWSVAWASSDIAEYFRSATWFAADAAGEGSLDRMRNKILSLLKKCVDMNS